jgi:hypothetical protein
MTLVGLERESLHGGSAGEAAVPPRRASKSAKSHKSASLRGLRKLAFAGKTGTSQICFLSLLQPLPLRYRPVPQRRDRTRGAESWLHGQLRTLNRRALLTAGRLTRR